MTVHFNDIPDQVGLTRGPQRADAIVRGRLYRKFFKRLIDAAFVLVTLPISVPIMLIFGLLVALDGHNPFYRQDRVGRNGRIFRIWKLRSMVPDADGLLASHLANDRAARQEWDASQKLKNDPRITRIGRFMRRTSIDELPQLINVLVGNMSLVGPRPMLVSQTSMYPGSAYFKMRPGITGMWQISDRNDCEFKDRAGHDTRYFNELSLGTDISVLASTIGVVLRCTGY